MSIELSVIVPIYNEEDELWPMAEQLSPVLDAAVGPGKWQYVLVDNGSTDSTPALIDKIIAGWPTSIRVLLDKPNYGSALAAGIREAQGEYGYIINVEFWDAIFLRWAWLNRCQYDLVLGSKRADPTINTQTVYRRLLSWGLNTLLQVFFGFVGRDTHGQKLIRLSTIRPLANICVMEGGQFDTELTLRALRGGLWLAEVPVPITETRAPRNWMMQKILRNLRDIVLLKFIMRGVPYKHNTRYHRWCREDMERMRVITWCDHDGE